VDSIVLNLSAKSIHDALVRLSDGDRSAMEPLVRELWPVILSFAARGLPQLEDAEDAAQEVFLKICARISDFDRRRDGLSWAFAIASYEVMTIRRRCQRRREATVDAERAFESISDLAPSQEEAAIRSELDALVLAAVGALSPADRTTLGLVETGGTGGANDATFRKRKQRALGRLRTVWRRLNGDS
jgi:RNA polymerase sigma factor (sigma-70 family)